MRKNFLVILCGLTVLSSGTNCHRSISASKDQKTKPNLLFILVDDLGWKDLGCYGSSFYDTPQLDAFAKESLRFTNAYSSSPVCSPTRAAIMTGKNPIRTGITDWLKGQNPPNRKLQNVQDRDELALEEYTLAEALKDNGYTTFFAGKWHLGEEGFYPEDQGFDINIGGHHLGSPPGGYYSPYQNPKLTDGPEGEYLPDRLTQETIQFVQNQKKSTQPFFAMLSFYTVHTPIQASHRHMDTYARKLPEGGQPLHAKEGDGQTLLYQVRADYGSMVTAMDENVGRLLQTLKENGLWDNTIIVFTSDNGGLTTLENNRQPPTSVRPLRAGKGWCYEGGIRVPLMIHMPGITEKGTESEAPVISHDFFPTFVESLGLKLAQKTTFDGLSLMPALRGKPLQRETLFWHYPHYHGSAWKPGAAIRQGNWKLVKDFETQQSELYDLQADIGETHDLSTTFPDKKMALEKLLLAKQQAMGAQFPVINPDYRE
ncbi:MAG: sulfatase [Saprospiraceae bacterium]